MYARWLAYDLLWGILSSYGGFSQHVILISTSRLKVYSKALTADRCVGYRIVVMEKTNHSRLVL